MSELIHKLGIDWKLLLAQVANFLILVFLLKKFLYGPVIALLAKRRRDITDAAENAERIMSELAHIESQKQEELEKARKEADAIVQEARVSAKERGSELIAEAERKVEKVVEEAKRHIKEERVKMLSEVGHEVKELVFMVTEKVLQERMPKEANAKFIQEAIAAVQKK